MAAMLTLDRGRRRRLLLIVSCTILFIFFPSFYYYHQYLDGVPILPLHNNVNEDPKNTNIGNADDTATLPILNDDVDDPSILHPERHVFRSPTTIHLTWNVTRELIAPDGVMKPVYLINGRFPGPTIEARSGDELIIDVLNSVEPAEEGGISIHWHGLYMKGSNDMDGVVGISQCVIGPFESHTYRFHIDDMQYGTFWYHAHSGVQRADGLFGGLIVHQPASDVNAPSDISTSSQLPERLLLVGDWYHWTAKHVFDWFQDSSHFGYEPASDSLLINGKGYFNCSMALKGRPVDCSLVEKPRVDLGEGGPVILRVINTGAAAGLAVSLSHARMTLIAVDGGNSVASDTPSATTIGVLYPGERMDLLVEPLLKEAEARGPALDGDSSEAGQYSATELTIVLDLENFRFHNFALMPTQSFPVIWKYDGEDAQKFDDSEPIEFFNLVDAAGSPVIAGASVAKKPDETTVLSTKMSIRSANEMKPVGSVNHTSWIVADPKAPPLLALDQSEWGTVTKQPSPIWTLDIPWFQESGEDRWMELVLNNRDDKGHVYHLHGYDFYVISTYKIDIGMDGAYNPFVSETATPPGPVNTINPLRKDTVYVPRNGHVILHFPLANDGLWLLHCHDVWHLGSGMGMVLHIGDLADHPKQSTAALCSK